jgi:hypothetical protein
VAVNTEECKINGGPILKGLFFFKLIYCCEMYKCLHEFFSKIVPDTSLNEI